MPQSSTTMTKAARQSVHVQKHNDHEEFTEELDIRDSTEIKLALVKFTQNTLVAPNYPFQNGYSIPYKFPTLTSTLKVLLGPGPVPGIPAMPDSSIQHNIARSILGIEGFMYEDCVMPLWTRNCPIIATAWKYGMGETSIQNFVYLHYGGGETAFESSHECNASLPTDITDYLPEIEVTNVPMPLSKTTSSIDNLTNSLSNWYSKTIPGGLPGSFGTTFTEPATAGASKFKIPHTQDQINTVLDSAWMQSGFVTGGEGLTIALNLINFRLGKYYQMGMSKSLYGHPGFNACISALSSVLDVERLLGNKVAHYGPFPGMNMYRLLDDMIENKSLQDTITNAVMSTYRKFKTVAALEQFYLKETLRIEWGLSQLYNDNDLISPFLTITKDQILDELNVFDNYVKCTQQLHFNFTQYLIRRVLLKQNVITSVDEFNIKVLNYTYHRKHNLYRMLNDSSTCRNNTFKIDKLESSEELINFDAWSDDLELSMAYHGYKAATTRPYSGLSAEVRRGVSQYAQFAPTGFFSANVASFNTMVNAGNKIKSDEAAGLLYKRYTDPTTPILDNDYIFDPSGGNQWGMTSSRMTFYPSPTDPGKAYKFLIFLTPSDLHGTSKNTCESIIRPPPTP